MILVNTILDQMSKASKAQRKFIAILLSSLLLVRGKATFRNLARYSLLCEKSYSRQFRKPFDFVGLNRLALSRTLPHHLTLIAALDCTFVEKSGKCTYGLDRFFNGKTSRVERGLELSELAVVCVELNTAYHLSARQTPCLDPKDVENNRIACYVHHIRADRFALPQAVRYLVADGYYAKQKFVDGVLATGLHLVSKLRHDANLRYLYTGPQKARGRRRLYDGKVHFSDLTRMHWVAQEGDLSIHTAVVNSVRFKRNLRLVFLRRQSRGKSSTALLFSTDTSLSALEVYRFYKARFQIEFLFRDARQFTGLTDCQARCAQSLHTHFNASLSALSLAKIEEQGLHPHNRPRVISVANWKIRNFNDHLLQRFSDTLGLDFNAIKSQPHYEQLINYGTVAG